MATEEVLLELMKKHDHPGPLVCSVLSDKALAMMTGGFVEILKLAPSADHVRQRPASGVLESWDKSTIMLRLTGGAVFVIGRDQIQEIRFSISKPTAAKTTKEQHE